MFSTFGHLGVNWSLGREDDTEGAREVQARCKSWQDRVRGVWRPWTGSRTLQIQEDLLQILLVCGFFSGDFFQAPLKNT